MKRALTTIFLLTVYPSLCSSQGWDKYWLVTIISKTDSPTDLLFSFKPSLLPEFMEKIKCDVKPHFLLHSISLHHSFCLKGGKALWFSLNEIHCKAVNNGRRKYLHIWVWRWIGQGDGIDVWCARRLMWTEAGGEKEMFLYRYPSLSAHHFSASWPWHHGGPGRKAEETIGSLCGSRACGGSMSTHAVGLQFWISFPHKEMTEVLAWYTINSGSCPHASSNYTEMLFMFSIVFEAGSAHW